VCNLDIYKYTNYISRVKTEKRIEQMFSQNYVRMNKANFAIVLFLILFGLFHFVKPGFAYGSDGEFRPFGVGYQNKTVIPGWTVAIALAILSYLAVMFYVSQ